MTADEPARGAHSDPDAAALEAGERLFGQEPQFLLGATREDQVPAGDLPEIAFAGRSNVGKSSLLNALTGRKALARISQTPGRTQQLNFFELPGRLMLVDLPGYGYAKAPKTAVAAWERLMRRYLLGRAQLRRVFILIDARHGPKPGDLAMMQALTDSAVSFQAVLTKCDKLKPGALPERLTGTASELRKFTAAHPEVLATSSVSGQGIAALRAQAASLAL